MSDYRRARVPGATYFFTVALAERGAGTLTGQVGLLRAAYATTIAEAPLRCDAMVVLPDHLHAVWTLPEGDADYSERWRRIKARFTRALARPGRPRHSMIVKRERGVWQRRFWEHRIRDGTDYRRHVEYCWGDPVKHGLVGRAVDWPYSSMHRDIRAGLVAPDWAGALPEGRFGEPVG